MPGNLIIKTSKITLFYLVVLIFLSVSSVTVQLKTYNPVFLLLEKNISLFPDTFQENLGLTVLHCQYGMNH